jgi:D-3-phosphoglycerate dehydrogenase
MKVSVFCNLWPEAMTGLTARYQCTHLPDPGYEDRAKALADSEVAIVRSPVHLDAAALAGAPDLRLIIRAGMGLDGIDVEEIARRKIALLTIPLSADAVAEHVFALLLSLARGLPHHDRALREGRWEKHAALARGLTGRSLGIIGFGRIGRRVAELAHAFRMTVCAFDRSPEKAAKQTVAIRLGVRFLPLDDLASESDCVCSTLPLDESTRRLLDREWIRRMRPGALFVNIGRGGVVDENALCDALEDGSLGGAALDVFENEPPADHPLLRCSGFIGTPHVAAQTAAAQHEIGEVVLRAVSAFAAGQDPAVPGTIRVT